MNEVMIDGVRYVPEKKTETDSGYSVGQKVKIVKSEYYLDFDNASDVAKYCYGIVRIVYSGSLVGLEVHKKSDGGIVRGDTVWSFETKNIAPWVDEPKKQDIREYCKEHRVWAVKASGKYKPVGWYWGRDKPRLDISDKSWNDSYTERLDDSKFTFPSVPWDKSLIAPDGSMPLMEEKKTVKHFEVGKWYVNVGKNEKVPMVDDKQAALDGKPHKCLKNDIEISADSHWDFAMFSGVNGGSWNWNPADWIEVPAPENKDDKPQRGDPVFVWDDNFEDTVPVGVSYFHHIKRGKVYVFCDGEPGECYDEAYDHYRKFDASLVGVPRRDWDK